MIRNITIESEHEETGMKVEYEFTLFADNPEKLRETTHQCPECDKVFIDFAEAEKHINDCIAYNDIRRNDP